MERFLEPYHYSMTYVLFLVANVVNLLSFSTETLFSCKIKTHFGIKLRKHEAYLHILLWSDLSGQVRSAQYIVGRAIFIFFENCL